MHQKILRNVHYSEFALLTDSSPVPMLRDNRDMMVTVVLEL